MENASRALIMAAGVLLGIMIISLGTYIFSMFSDFAKEQETELYNHTISEFNNQFLKYENATDITLHDIISLANLARDNNQKYGVTQEGSPYVAIYIGTEKMETKSVEDLNRYIENNAYKTDASGKTALQYYTCKTEDIVISTATNKVEKVIFRKQ